jgi:hypothetical protein
MAKRYDPSTLQGIRAFLQAVDVEGQREQAREFLTSHRDEVAAAFGVTPSVLLAAVDNLPEDADLISKTLGSVEIAIRKAKDAKVDARWKAACDSVAKVAAAGRWEGDRFTFDVDALLSELGSDPQAFLMVDGWNYAHAIPIRKLRQTAALRKELTGWIDYRGIHFRWATGGLSFVGATMTRGATLIPMALPSQAKQAEQAQPAALPAPVPELAAVAELASASNDVTPVAPRPAALRPPRKRRTAYAGFYVSFDSWRRVPIRAQA